ncbi:MAG: flagellar hook-basal body complex protein FliE [Acetobacteraceae bacterium]|jgi:flagellar hook-basal body complex protein FliE|nr:flagellar hook-basal body protein FleE [Rhodopila sp.]MEA2726926.1 flagellar hook-basal body complex protein FliE [Acetobacteraceae bacterium]MEA2767287.1 flagellar hook-basal body complex protein FliE [Acetobacteraceae bacterium]
MTAIPTIVITPSAAADAYTRNAPGAGSAGGPNSFGAAITQALDQAVQTGHNADDQAMKALSGGGNLTEVVTAVSHAEMTLQAATVIRDRVVQAYQDIMKMPI